MRKFVFQLFLIIAFVTNTANAGLFGDGTFKYNGLKFIELENGQCLFASGYDPQYPSLFGNPYRGMTEIVIPETVQKKKKTLTVVGIAKYAFQNCEHVKKLILPNTCTYFEQNTRAPYFDELIVPPALYGKIKKRDCSIPFNYRNCKITLRNYNDYNDMCNSETLVTSELDSWINEKGIVLVDSLGNEITNLTIPEGITSINIGAFHGCSKITSVNIPNSVTAIGSLAFNNCSSLKSVTIPNSITTIEEGTFTFCSGLTNINLPNSVTSIGEWAFAGCASLTTINLPNSVNLIGKLAFQGCTNLTTVTSSNPNITIADDAFESCSKLKEFPNAYHDGYLKNLGMDEQQIAAYNKCENGSATANDMIVVAKFYYNKEMYDKAWPLFNGAAEQGNATAQFYLGNYYYYGKGNISTDNSKAAEWYRKAANQGDDYAQVILGYMYENGIGTTVNKAEAVKWYRKAANQGNAAAQWNLYLCYRDGKGVAKNTTLANQWLKKAADNGDSDAQDVLANRKKTQKRTDDLAALKNKIGITTFNNLNKGVITKGMKWSSIMAFRDYINKYNYLSGATIIDNLPSEVKVGGITLRATKTNAYVAEYAILFSNRRGGDISGGFISVSNGVVTSVNIERAR